VLSVALTPVLADTLKPEEVRKKFLRRPRAAQIRVVPDDVCCGLRSRNVTLLREYPIRMRAGGKLA
jgi:hypothetical protein